MEKVRHEIKRRKGPDRAAGGARVCSSLGPKDRRAEKDSKQDADSGTSLRMTGDK